MHKINTETADANNEFVDENASQGIEPTDLNAAWFNSVQRELCNIVTKSGGTLSASDDSQIWKIISALGFKTSKVTSSYTVSSDFKGNVVLYQATPSNLSISGSLNNGSIVVIIPNWTGNEAADAITVTYRNTVFPLYKQQLFVGIVDDNLLRGKVINSADAYGITWSYGMVDRSLVQFAATEDPDADLQDWQKWQLKSRWQIGQVKRVICSDAGDNGTSVIVFKNDQGQWHNVWFYPNSYRELVCVGSYTTGGIEFAILKVNGKDKLHE